ncbi:hypothetical protein [uncultured Corynebacterium sp.]|nr:hypothetical protein [uncultured Corynebacterium sp.]
MVKVTNRVVDELTAQQQARSTHDAAQRRRDAPARGHFVAGGED